MNADELNLGVLAGNGSVNVTNVVSEIINRTLPIEPSHIMIENENESADYLYQNFARGL